MAPRVLAAVLAGGAIALSGAGGADVPARRPAVLFAGYPHCTCAHHMARRLDADGLAVNAMGWPGLEGPPLTWDRVQAYNVIVVAGLGLAAGDLSLGDRLTASIAVLRRFLDEGGGILFLPVWCQMETSLPPQAAFMQPYGLKPLPQEVVFDRDPCVTATAWKVPFAYTTNVLANSPVTAGVTGLWYPAATRAGAQQHTTTFTTDDTWTILVRGTPGSMTRVVPFDRWLDADEAAPGTHDHAVPLAAVREAGRGRLMCLGITPEYLYGSAAATTLEGIVLDRGLRQTPSGGYTLFRNGLLWLAEPSLAAGTLGGAATDPSLLADPTRPRLQQPADWLPAAAPPPPDPPNPGLIGARTALSVGKGTVADWAARARSLGLAFLVFLEEFAELTRDEFEQLRAACAQTTTPGFAAIPGFVIDDEVGNHYFYFGTGFPYPEPRFLTPDGKRLASYDPELDPRNPHLPGQLAMTTLVYAYSLGGFKLTAGNFLYSQDAAPFANFFSNWNAAAVMVHRDGRLLEDAVVPYLQLVDAGQGPVPIAIEFVDDPDRLGAAAWRTVVRAARAGGRVTAGELEGANTVAAYWNLWHFYPDNPTRVYITSGPEIETWSFAGPRDYEGNNPGDFARPNLHWRVFGRVTAPAGLRSVVVHDGEDVFRRFLPAGETAFEFTLDLAHDRQHNLVLVAEDQRGGRAIAGEQWDRNHRLEEFNCSDRNNQLSYGLLIAGDGTAVMIGGNQSLGTPNKRLDGREISPSGTFRNDALLGAPAFDGAAGGEPAFFAPLILRTPDGEVRCPDVVEARRLLHTADTSLGEGRFEHNFADGIRVANVWHTLWRTEPATDFTVAWRRQFFTIDPDSPLAVFLWRFRVTLRRDLPNQGIQPAGFIRLGEARLWALRGSDGSAWAGAWEETPRSEDRFLTVPFGLGASAAVLDSPLGGAAVFPLTDGMEAQIALPARSGFGVRFNQTAAATPQRAGQECEVAFLIVGIPRATERTRRLPSPTTEVVERFAHDFGLRDGRPAYSVAPRAGTVTGRRYVLAVDGRESAAFSGTLAGDLVSTLPIAVSGLADRWSAVLYDRRLRQSRPIGVFEGTAWAVVRLHGELDLFVGHPVTCDRPEVTIQATQTGETVWTVEVHNPTDAPVRTVLRRNPEFDPFRGAAPEEVLDVPAGASVVRTMTVSP